MKRLVILALFAAACSGKSAPTGPTPSAPTLSIRDGWTGETVAASASPADPAVGQPLTVTAPGYLDRVQPFAGAPVFLWPQDLAYVQAMVYHVSVGGELARWTSGFAVGLGGLSADTEVASVTEKAAAEISRTTELSVSVGQSGEVSVTINPKDPGFTRPAIAALTYLTLQDSTIRSARVVARSRSDLLGVVVQNTLLHELGHVVGLGHSQASSDAMYPTQSAPGVPGFSLAEQITLRMMYRHRSPGNVAPDTAPGVSSAGLGVREVLIAD